MYPYMILGIVSLYDVFVIIGVVSALFLADKMGIARGFSVALQKVLIFSALSAIIFGFFGAVFFQAVYNAIETGVFEIKKDTGMTFYGGLIFGVIAFWVVWFCVGKKLCKDNEAVKKFGILGDIAGCVIPLAHGFGRLGCLMAGCCHGAETNAWYGIKMWTKMGWVRVIPVQLFEAIFLFALSGVMFWLFFKKFTKNQEARFPLLPTYAIGYGIWRFLIEYLRGDYRGKTIVSFLTPSQLIALVMIAAGVVYICLWQYQKNKDGKNHEE